MDPIDPLEVDLLFLRPPLSQQPIDLLFGDPGDIPPQNAEARLAATLPALTLSAFAGTILDVRFSATLPGLTAAMRAVYDSNVARPLIRATRNPWQLAATIQDGIQAAHQVAEPMKAEPGVSWQHARATNNGIEGAFDVADSLRERVDAAYQDATQSGRLTGNKYQEARRTRRTFGTSFQTGIDTRPTPTTGVYQDAIRRRTQRTTRWQPASLWGAAHRDTLRAGADVRRGYGAAAQAGRPPQPAVPPYPPEPPAPPGPCYIPPDGLEADLVFTSLYASDGSLLFFCELHGPLPARPPIIVPARRVYIVVNNVSLVRASDNEPIPSFSLSLSLDADSWTWGWRASIPASARALVESAGTPTAVLANVNGAAYRLIVESISQERTFGDSRISVSGRGANAALDAPYSPVITLTNTQQRTAQQLVADALTVNGVPLGWTLEWGLTDWLVPENSWSYQGTYMGAVTEIAEAAGGYVQPHPTAETLRIRARYPVAPWDWGNVSPDYELPASVVQRESLQWINKPEYNRVYVAGQRNGILGEVTRTGSPGDLLAPMAVDQLITHVDAARQRGISILADTGRQIMVGLRLPVLQSTGIIEPGKFVRYTDGGTTRLGIVRSTSVDATYPEVWQSIEVETHA